MSSRERRPRSPRGRSSRPRSSPARTPARASARTPARTAGRPVAAPLSPDAVAATRPRSRFTGRAAVLVLVLAVLTVSYASSMRAYLQQRSHINDLKAQIAQHNANIDALETEKKRWNDPAYVEDQARQRLGYVMPGEKTYLVLDEHGKPVEAQASLDHPATVSSASTPAWWADAWGSVELAGNPPKVAPASQPASKINGARESGG